MFEHVELVIPPTTHVTEDVGRFMRYVMRKPTAWCDMYFIGGAWNGLKQIIDLDLAPFNDRLDEMKVTVSPVRWAASRDSLSPESQAAAVDAEWRSLCPGRGDSCPLFAQYQGPLDINWCPVADLPARLKADRLVVAKPCIRRKVIHMLDEGQLRPFDSEIRSAIRALQIRTPRSPADDWLVVSLCCHW